MYFIMSSYLLEWKKVKEKKNGVDHVFKMVPAWCDYLREPKLFWLIEFPLLALNLRI